MAQTIDHPARAVSDQSCLGHQFLQQECDFAGAAVAVGVTDNGASAIAGLLAKIFDRLGQFFVVLFRSPGDDRVRVAVDDQRHVGCQLLKHLQDISGIDFPQPVVDHLVLAGGGRRIQLADRLFDLFVFGRSGPHQHATTFGVGDDLRVGIEFLQHRLDAGGISLLDGIGHQLQRLCLVTIGQGLQDRCDAARAVRAAPDGQFGRQRRFDHADSRQLVLQRGQ